MLTRRIGESIIIGDDTEVIVTGVDGCQVKLGIKAPKNVQVHRKEIFEKIKREGYRRTPGNRR
jgi:carbon storage regulator